MKNMFEELNAHRLAVQENIKKAFEVGFTGNDIEKAKQWQVGDEATDKHGVTYYVHALNAAGKPLWRKKKDSGANANNSSSTGRGNNSVKNSSSKQADDIVLTNEDYDRVFHNVGLSRQTPFEHNNKLYILKIFGKHMDGSYLISVHNGDTGKKLQGDSNIAISVRRAFINQLKQEKLRDIERNAKKKQAKSTDDTQSDDKVKLTEGDFKKGVVEKDEYTRKNAIDLHDYTGKSIEYYTDNGEKKKAQPYISEFYDSAKQDAVGGYEAYFDRADSIGTFRTLKEAISALETWINNMRVKGHAKPKWIYNESGGRYQMNYRLN